MFENNENIAFIAGVIALVIKDIWKEFKTYLKNRKHKKNGGLLHDKMDRIEKLNKEQNRKLIEHGERLAKIETKLQIKSKK